jgi:rhodanese-related sulfurtransferase
VRKAGGALTAGPFLGRRLKTMEATRVTADEVKERMDRGEQFAFVDTRNPQAWGEADKKLPGALRVPADEVERHLKDIPRDRVVITYCT